jgi:hypothetical protein
MALLTATLIVKDESARLARCLTSVAGLVDRVVVVDTGSIDDTVAIATAAGATVHHEPWRDDFAHARNVALSLVTTPWALVFDADEELVDTDIAETRERLATPDALPDILLVRERLRYPGKGPTGEPDEALILAPRLLKMSANPRYLHAVHEQLDVSDAPAALSNLTLLHHGYADPSALRRKEARNLRLAERMERNPHALHCIARAALSLGEWGKTVEASDALLAHPESSPALRREAAVLAALAALGAKDTARFGHFLAHAQRVDATHVDVLHLALLAAASRYATAVRRGAQREPELALRPPLLFHDTASVLAMIASLTRRSGAAPGAAPRSSTGPSNPSAPSLPDGWS